MKKCIAVVEPISTGKNYIFEIAKRGYTPIAVFPWNDTDEKVREEYEASHRRPCINLFPKETIVIYGSKKYEEFILELKKYPIECVVAGSEQGVIICDRIAEDLKVAGNPVSRSKSHIDKNEMQNALKDYGIRYIKGMLVHSVDEAGKFLADEHIEKSVVKHVDGAGSVGLHICSTVEECLEAVQQELGNSVMYSHNTESVLVQEFIEGTEYVVNTMSSNGEHCITDIWKYNKVKMGSAGNPYENCELITELKPEHVRMCQYAYEVVEALGIKYGPTHGEYMMMPSGEVVLIEAGARPMGGNMPQTFLDEMLGHHIVDISLDSYLDYERFLAFKEKPYRPIKSGMMVFLITPNDMQISDMPIFNILKNLKSLYRVNIDGVLASENLKKTVDLETASGVLYLFHEDEAQVSLMEGETVNFGLSENEDGTVDVISDMDDTNLVYDGEDCIIGDEHVAVLTMSNESAIASGSSTITVYKNTINGDKTSVYSTVNVGNLEDTYLASNNLSAGMKYNINIPLQNCWEDPACTGVTIELDGENESENGITALHITNPLFANKITIYTYPNDITYGVTWGDGNYEEGSTVALGAAANAGYQFQNWTMNLEML